MPYFQLVHVSGEDLSVHRFAVPDWKVGQPIPRGGGTPRLIGVEWT